MPDKPKSKPKQNKIDDQTRQVAWDELCRLLIRGMNHRQAASELGFHITTIQKWLAKPEFKTKLLRTRQQLLNPPKDATSMAIVGDIKETIRVYAREAIDKMYVLMQTGEHERTQLKAAQELADRSEETQKTRNVKIGGAVMLFKPEDLVLMAQTAKEIQTDIEIGYHVEPAALDESIALPIEAEPFELDH